MRVKLLPFSRGWSREAMEQWMYETAERGRNGNVPVHARLTQLHDRAN